MTDSTPRVVPCVLMRGGTSRGPFFLREWLPAPVNTGAATVKDFRTVR